MHENQFIRCDTYCRKTELFIHGAIANFNYFKKLLEETIGNNSQKKKKNIFGDIF